MMLDLHEGVRELFLDAQHLTLEAALQARFVGTGATKARHSSGEYDAAYRAAHPAKDRRYRDTWNATRRARRAEARKAQQVAA